MRAFATLVRMFYNQGLADQLETLANDFGTLAASSSLPSCYHCVVIIHAKLGLPHFRRSPIAVPPTRTPRGLAARGVPVLARRARAMGVPASRALRLRRRRLLARRLLGVGVLVRWRAARCARAALALRSRYARAAGSRVVWTRTCRKTACRRGRDGLGPWVRRRPASCGCGGGGS